MRRVATAWAVCLLLAPPPEAEGSILQDTSQVVIDSLVPPGDSLQIDTALTDTTVGSSFVPVVPDQVPLGPLAPGARYVFTRDSLFWTSALTLSDLLGSVPGVYIARGGFFGQPEYLQYAGRGPSSIEVYWDGFLVPPMGGDTVYFDPGRIPLSYLSRIDVEVLPSMLRIYLVSERHGSLAPRSVVRVMSGAFSTAEYAGLFQKRWASGFGLNLAGDFQGSDGGPALNRSDQSLDLWAKFEWLPKPRMGAVYQIRRQSQERDPYSAEGGIGVPARDGVRTEFLFNFFASTRDDGLGARFEAGLGTSGWARDTAGPDPETLDNQSVRQAFAAVRYALPHLTAEVRGRAFDARDLRSVEANLSWIPLRGIVMSASGRTTDHSGNRRSRSGGASLGLYAGPFSLTGEVNWRDGIQAPALLSDSSQETTDASLRFGVSFPRRLTGSVSLVRRDAFVPVAAPLDFPDIVAMDTAVEATYLIANATVHLAQPLILQGWYAHPSTVAADLQPPTHIRGDVVFRSRFFRAFRSGVYDFMLRYGIESWGAGTAGIDVNGAPIILPSASFHEMYVEFQLVDFRLFWNLRNARNSLAQYVPGLPYPRNAQTFGVRWEFFN